MNTVGKEDPPWYESLFSCLCDNPVREGVLVVATEKRIRRQRAVDKLGTSVVDPDHISFINERGRNGPHSSRDLLREPSPAIHSGNSSEVGISNVETEWCEMENQKPKEEAVSTKCCGFFSHRARKWKS